MHFAGLCCIIFNISMSFSSITHLIMSYPFWRCCCFLWIVEICLVFAFMLWSYACIGGKSDSEGVSTHVGHFVSLSDTHTQRNSCKGDPCTSKHIHTAINPFNIAFIHHFITFSLSCSYTVWNWLIQTPLLVAVKRSLTKQENCIFYI